MAGLKGKKIKISRRTERGGEDGEDIKKCQIETKERKRKCGKNENINRGKGKLADEKLIEKMRNFLIKFNKISQIKIETNKQKKVIRTGRRKAVLGLKIDN